jgi:hypothetical protein
VWKDVPEGEAEIRFQPGSFAENDYDTSGYEESYDTSGAPASSFDGSEVQRLEDANESGREELDEGTVRTLRERVAGTATEVDDGRE